jgi:hypothetical protein
MMMSNKGRVFLAAVAVIMAAAVPASVLSAGASTSAIASTTACGSACLSLSPDSNTGDYLTVSGSSVGVAAASTTNPGQDFTMEQDQNVQWAVQEADLLPAKLMLLYNDSYLVEFQYAPSGKPSGECLADGYSDDDTDEELPDEVNAPNTTVTLATCGLTLATLWLVDQNQNSESANGYVDLINAGYAASYGYLAPESAVDPVTTPYADPYVLTLNSSGDVVLAQLSEIGGVISTGQLWYGGSGLAQEQAQAEAAAKSAAARRAAGKP